MEQCPRCMTMTGATWMGHNTCSSCSHEWEDEARKKAMKKRRRSVENQYWI